MKIASYSYLFLIIAFGSSAFTSVSMSMRVGKVYILEIMAF